MIARRILRLALGLVLVGSLGAQITGDVGGTIRNVTGFGSEGFAQRDRVAIRAELRGPKTLFEIAAAYTLAVAEGQISHLPDVESLALTSSYLGDGAPLSRFDFTMGRQRVMDHTGWVLNQVLDGIALTVAYPVARITATAGTTFLPNKNGAPVVLSRGDAMDLANPLVLMGSPRAVGLVEVVFPNILRQELTVSFGMQEDLRGLLGTDTFPNRTQLIQPGEEVQQPAKSGLVDTQYMGLGARGGIIGGLFYNVFGTLGTGRTLSYVIPEGSVAGSYSYTPILSGLGGAGLTFYAPKVLGSVASFRFVLSTGEGVQTDRTSILESSTTSTPNLFLPVTAIPISPVLGASLGNISFAELGYSLRPFASAAGMLSRLQIGLTGLLFIRPAQGPISTAVPNAEATSAYLGSELDLRVTWRPFSDLGVEVLAGAFLPNTAAAGAFAGEALRMKAEASVSLSL